MERFIELPVHLVSQTMEDLGIQSDEIPVSLSVRPDHISAFRKAVNEDGKERSAIYLISGEFFIIELNIDILTSILRGDEYGFMRKQLREAYFTKENK